MNRAMTKSELVKRYLHEIRRYLGSRAPNDLEKELESLLHESFEARERELGRELDLNELAEVMKAFGDPSTVAARYDPRPRYLIGPGLYPAFVVVAKVLIGLAVLIPLLQLFGSGLKSDVHPSFSTALLFWVQTFWQIAFGGTAVAVLFFALLERSLSVCLPPSLLEPISINSSVRENGGTGSGYSGKMWDPLSMLPVEDPDRVSSLGPAISICLITLLTIVLNFYQGGLAALLSLRPTSLRDFGIHLPIWVINVWWLLEFVKNFFLLREGRWRKLTRYFQFSSGILGAASLYLVLRAVSVVTQQPNFKESLENPGLAPLLGRFIPMALLLFILCSLAKSAIHLYRILRTRSSGHHQPQPLI